MKLINRINLFLHYIWWTRKLHPPFRLKIRRLWQISDKIYREKYLKQFELTHKSK